ncbi:MAG: peptide MFS transporter [Alphaproteobacteria bacterium]
MTAETDLKIRRDKAFFGHPAGLGWLSASEFWERFSYYGMQTLLVLYMVDPKNGLLLPSHAEHVFGFVPFRHLLESVYGPLQPQPLASIIFGLYAGIVYLTPLAGGLLADRVIGRTRAVTIGASLMAIGHFLMAFEQSFLLALLCLLIGVGCFKGNIASQVGDLYAQDDSRRADAFQIYTLGIQLAVIGSPIICSTLAHVYNWHYGFGAAGVGMVIGLTTYLIGRPNFPPEPARKTIQAIGAVKTVPAFTVNDWRRVIILIALLPVLAASVIGNQQMGNAYLVWGQKALAIYLFGWRVPVEWLVSLDSGISAITIVGVVVFWRWWGERWAEPDELLKVAMGVVLATIAPLPLVAAASIYASSGHQVSLLWAVAFHFINDIGFANILPVGLALYTRAAPKGLSGLMVGIYYLHLFAGNMLTGWLGGLLDSMPAAQFWLLHVAIMGVAAAALFIVHFTVGRVLTPAYDAPAANPQPAA